MRSIATRRSPGTSVAETMAPLRQEAETDHTAGTKTAQAPAPQRGGRLGDNRYGLAVVWKTSVRFVVLPGFVCTNTGTNVFPIVASPS